MKVLVIHKKTPLGPFWQTAMLINLSLSDNLSTEVLRMHVHMKGEKNEPLDKYGHNKVLDTVNMNGWRIILTHIFILYKALIERNQIQKDLSKSDEKYFSCKMAFLKTYDPFSTKNGKFYK